MFKKEFVYAVCDVLKDNDITKKIAVPNYPLYVVDDHDNKKMFSIKVPDREVNYTIADVRNVLDAMLAVMEDCLKRGDEITLFGVGTFGVKRRAPKMVKLPGTDEWTTVPEYYSPYVKFGNVFKSAARLYGKVLDESSITLPDPIYDEDDESEDGDE